MSTLNYALKKIFSSTSNYITMFVFYCLYLALIIIINFVVDRDTLIQSDYTMLWYSTSSIIIYFFTPIFTIMVFSKVLSDDLSSGIIVLILSKPINRRTYAIKNILITITISIIAYFLLYFFSIFSAMLLTSLKQDVPFMDIYNVIFQNSNFWLLVAFGVLSILFCVGVFSFFLTTLNSKFLILIAISIAIFYTVVNTIILILMANGTIGPNSFSNICELFMSKLYLWVPTLILSMGLASTGVYLFDKKSFT